MWMYNWNKTAIINLDLVQEIQIFELNGKWFIKADGEYLEKDLESREHAEACLHSILEIANGIAWPEYLYGEPFQDMDVDANSLDVGEISADLFSGASMEGD